MRGMGPAVIDGKKSAPADVDQGVAGGGHLAEIEVDSVGKRLKTIERKTERQEPLPVRAADQRNHFESG